MEKSELVEVDIIGSKVQTITCYQCGFVVTDTCAPCPNCGYSDCGS